MIKFIPGNPVYCHLDIIDVPFDFGKAFSTVTYSGKTLLSAKNYYNYLAEQFSLHSDAQDLSMTHIFKNKSVIRE